MSGPNVILLFSGKRKSGKDYISEKLHSLLGTEKSQIIRISEPIKTHYAKVNNLDLQELMSDNPYKEKYRQDMIIWSDEVRRKDPGYFCNAAIENAELKQIWIVSDIRRKTDIIWFKNKYKNLIRTIRIVADIETRTERGWNFKKGVDDVASECDLDDYTEWDLITNNNDPISFEEGIANILHLVKTNYS